MASKSLTPATFVCTVPAGCQTSPLPSLNDGEPALPMGYKSWPRFLSAIQRPDTKQVWEIYMHEVVTKNGMAEKGFPNGSVFIMEIYASKAEGDTLGKHDE